MPVASVSAEAPRSVKIDFTLDSSPVKICPIFPSIKPDTKGVLVISSKEPERSVGNDSSRPSMSGRFPLVRYCKALACSSLFPYKALA